MEQEGRSATLAEMDVVGTSIGAGIRDGLLSQDSDLFNLLPIIEAVTKGKATRRMISMW